MEEICQRYDAMWSNAKAGFGAGFFEFDPLIDDATDTRRGITLVGRLRGGVVSELNRFLDEIRKVEPEQYVYPVSDLHITAMAVITAHADFTMDGILVADYVPVIEEALAGMGPLEIAFRGITASPSCIMIQGFPQDNALNRLRDRLREAFGNASVFSTIDVRYRIITAHSTVLRFRTPVTRGAELVEILTAYRHHDFGTIEIPELELVFNDWYQRAANTRRLHRFGLCG